MRIAGQNLNNEKTEPLSANFVLVKSELMNTRTLKQGAH